MPVNFWPHQSAEIDAHALTPKRAFLWSPRLGKSLGAGGSLHRVWYEHGVRRALVTCPLVVAPMWLETLTTLGLPAVPLYGVTVKKALKVLSQCHEGVLIVNDDRIAIMLQQLVLWGIQANIIDESHRMKGVSSSRGIALRRISHAAQWTRLLTGTPVPNHYGDLWGQFNALSPDDWGRSYYGRGGFADRFLILDTQYRSRVLGHKNVAELQALLLRYASILRREDVFGPDHFQYIVRDVDLPERVWQMYHKLARLWVLDDPNIEATNIVVRLMRLQQITSGFLPDGDSTTQIHDAKIVAVTSDLAEIVEAGEKAVVFHHFTAEGNAVHDYVRGTFLSKEVLVLKIDGTNSDEGFAIAERFNRWPGPAVAVVQTQAGGIGISLKEATHALVLSQNFSFTAAEQARDRIYKQGARRVVTHYRAPGTTDDFIAETLERKETIHDAVRHADREALIYGTFARKKTRLA